MNKLKIDRPKLLPPNAKRVHKGILFDVYQWPQKMFDRSIKTFEMVKRPDTIVFIAVTLDKKIILEKQTQPSKGTFYSLPAGHTEKGKDLIDEGLRELQEETGYSPETIKIWKSVRPSSKMDYMSHFLIGQNCTKITRQSLDSGEKISLQLITLEKLLQMFVSKEIKLNEIVVEMLKAHFDKGFRRKMEEFFFL